MNWTLSTIGISLEPVKILVQETSSCDRPRLIREPDERPYMLLRSDGEWTSQELYGQLAPLSKDTDDWILHESDIPVH